MTRFELQHFWRLRRLRGNHWRLLRLYRVVL